MRITFFVLLQILWLVIFPGDASAQDNSLKSKIDSIQIVVKKAKHDSTRIKGWIAWDDLIYAIDPVMDKKLNEKVDSLAKRVLKKSGLTKKEKYFFQFNQAYALNNLGLIQKDIGNFDQSIKYLKSSLTIREEIKDLDGSAASYNNLGMVYRAKGDQARAIECYTKSLTIQESRGNDFGAARALNNIGNLYWDNKDPQHAIDYYHRCMLIMEKIGDKQGLASSYNNIANCYDDLKQREKAKQYYEKGLKIKTELNDKLGMAIALSNLGALLMKEKKFDDAIVALNKSLELSNEMGDKKILANTMSNLCKTYNDLGKYTLSIEFGTKALNLAKEIGALKEGANACQSLYEAYKQNGDFKKAMLAYEEHVLLRDSLNKEENQKEIIRQEYKYEYEKQAAADSVRNLEEKKVKDAFIAQQKAELKAKRNQQFMLFGGLALVLVFAGFIFNRFRVTKKQKGIIEHQKAEVEEKNKEITDSINYAKRIQTAILPPHKIIKEMLPDSFVLYKPKDIVAGDFYWLEKKGETVLFAACDCTGHGVPGAMVSVICNNGLNRSVREYNLIEPGKILDKTREIVIQEFEKSEEEVKDGMDVSLLAFNGRTIKWSGANNPLWIIRGGEIIEWKADKQPIGKYANSKPFTTHEIEIHKGDMVYIFTDGLQDQFGGEKGKKFKASKLKELLLSVQDKSMDEQKQIVEQTFESWRGGLEQNDDVCIIGIRI